MKEAIFRFLHFIAYASERDGIEGVRFYIFLFLCAAGIVLAVLARRQKGNQGRLSATLAAECRMYILLWGGYLMPYKTTVGWYNLTTQAGQGPSLPYHFIPLLIAVLALLAARLLKWGYQPCFQPGERFVLLERCVYALFAGSLTVSQAINAGLWYCCTLGQRFEQARAIAAFREWAITAYMALMVVLLVCLIVELRKSGEWMKVEAGTAA